MKRETRTSILRDLRKAQEQAIASANYKKLEQVTRDAHAKLEQLKADSDFRKAFMPNRHGEYV